MASNEHAELRLLLENTSFQTLEPLDEAIAVYRRLSALPIILSPDRQSLHRVLRNLHARRYDETESLADLDAAIFSGETVINGDREERENTGTKGSSDADVEALSVLLLKRFGLVTKTSDLERCIELGIQLTESTTCVDTAKIRRLNFLAAAYLTQFLHSNDVQHLDKSITKSEEALSMSIKNTTNKPICLHNLSARYLLRFQLLSLEQDLKKADDLNAEALASVSQHQEYPRDILLNQARIAYARFSNTHFWGELDEALRLGKEATERPRTNAISTAVGNQNLAVFHLQRYRVTKKLADIRQASQLASVAVTGLERWKVGQMGARETMLEVWLAFFMETGKISHLQDILDTLEDQINDAWDGTVRKAKRQQYRNLLMTKYEHTGSHVDLLKLCYEAILELQAKGGSDNCENEQRRSLNSVLYLFGELFRLILVPQYVNVRDALISSLHRAILEYKTSGFPGMLLSFLKKHDILALRMDVYGGGTFDERESIIGSSWDNLTKMAAVSNLARLKARTDSDPRPLTQFRFRMMDYGLTPPNPKVVDIADARKAIEQFRSPNEAGVAAVTKLQVGENYYKLAQALWRRYEETQGGSEEHSLTILEEGIAASTQALDKLNSNSKECRGAVGLIISLSARRAEISRSKPHHDAVIEVIQRLIPRFQAPEMTRFLKLNLCQSLRFRFLGWGDVEDLKWASAIAEELVPAGDIDHSQHAYSFDTLSIVSLVLKSSYQWLGNIEALDRGIVCLRLSLAANFRIGEAPSPHRRAQNKASLAFMLRLRFRRTHSSNDIEEAARLGRSALAELSDISAAEDVIDTTRNNVSIILEDLYKTTKDQRDLDEAISLAESVKDPLNLNLANLLLEKFETTSELAALDRATSISEELRLSMKDSSDPHSNLALHDCAQILFRKYQTSQEMRYLEEATDAAEVSLGRTPKEVPWYSENLFAYAKMLTAKWSLLKGADGAAELRRKCIEVYEQAWRNEFGGPPVRLKAAYCAAKLHGEHQDWSSAATLLEQAVHFLAKVCPPWLHYKDRQRLLQELHGLASDAASVLLKAHKSPYEALRVLELSRGVIMGSAIDYRREISELGEEDAELFREFNRLRMALDSLGDERDPGLNTDRWPKDSGFMEYGEELKVRGDPKPVEPRRMKTLHEELSHLLAHIRSKPGFEDFLEVPRSEVLLKMAQDGPIVFVIRSDLAKTGLAIVLHSGSIDSIDLPGLKDSESETRLRRMRAELPYGSLRSYAERNRQFEEELSWLWFAVVKPVADHIQSGVQTSIGARKLLHIRWIGVGALSGIPLHAAGDNFSKCDSNTMRHFVSSYTSSVRALQYVKRSRPRLPSLDRLLVATMETTPRATPLPSAAKELFVIYAAVGGSIPIVPLTRPTAAKVLKELPHNNLIHFACHGISDPLDPFHSHLLLSDPNTVRYGSSYYGRSPDTEKPSMLSVRDLLDRRAPKADFAYISACSTANIKVSSLADENVHIASGFQLAGFRHVVASLWDQKDRVCLEIAGLFYRELFRLRKEAQATPDGDWPVALALHNVVFEVRSRRPDMVLQWASFVHIGT